MASYLAVSVISSAILGILEEHYPREECGNLTFEVYDGSNFDTSKVKEGFSLFLYRISISGTNRNLHPRRGPNNKQFRPSLPMDLHYLLTAWSLDPKMKHLMMGWAMRMMEDMSVIPPGILNSYAKEPGTFGSNESIELICDPLPLNDLFNLWDKLKPKMQTSMTYVVRRVLIDSEVEQPLAAPVQARESSTGKKEES